MRLVTSAALRRKIFSEADIAASDGPRRAGSAALGSARAFAYGALLASAAVIVLLAVTLSLHRAALAEELAHASLATAALAAGASESSSASADASPRADAVPYLAQDARWPPPPPRPNVAAFLGRALRPSFLAGYDVWTSRRRELTPASSPAGVLLLFHGCGHTAEVWASGAEEQAAVDAFGDLGVFVVALSAASSRASDADANAPGRGCWDVYSDGAANGDLAMVAAVANVLQDRWRQQSDPALAAAAGAAEAAAADAAAAFVAADAVAGSAAARRRLEIRFAARPKGGAELASEAASARAHGEALRNATAVAVEGRGRNAAPARAGPLAFYGLGASSGGMFVMLVSVFLQLRGAAVYIMGAHPFVSELLEPQTHRGELSLPKAAAVSPRGALAPELAARTFPRRVAFASMPRDDRTEAAVAADVSGLEATGRVAPGSLRRFALLPRRIDAATFSDAMPALLSPAASVRLVDRLLSAEASAGAVGEGALLTRLAPAVEGAAMPPQPLLAGDPAEGQWLARDGRSAAFVAAVDAFLNSDVTLRAGLLPGSESSSGSSGGAGDSSAGVVAWSPSGADPLFDVRPSPELPAPASAPALLGGAGGTRRTPAADEAWRVLRRNLLETLNERFAAHEMSGQRAAEVARWCVGLGSGGIE